MDAPPEQNGNEAATPSPAEAAAPASARSPAEAADPPPHSDGVLYPSRLPVFHRVLATGAVAAFVRWFWISEWDIGPGRASRQHIIGYPASNLVVSHDRTEFAGPTTRVSHRDLSGTGWAVGALLQPAAIPLLVDLVHLDGASANSLVSGSGPTTKGIAALRDTVQQVALPELESGIRAAMTSSGPPADSRTETGRTEAVRAFAAWLTAHLGTPTADGLLANDMTEAAETQHQIVTVPGLASHLHVSQRTLQRLSATHVGLPPGMLIRRRRLQDGARRLREQPDLNLTDLAHELGYADHAHLTHDWRTVLGITPAGYRRSTAPDDPPHTSPLKRSPES